MDSVPPPPVPCPLNDASGEDRERLHAEWQRLLSQLDGYRFVELWLVGAHLHISNGLVELGVRPELAESLRDRFGRTLERVAGKDVRFVGCQVAEAQAQQQKNEEVQTA